MGPGNAVIGCRPSDKLWNIPGGPSAIDLPGMVHNKEPIRFAFEKRKKYTVQRNRIHRPKEMIVKQLD